jgi:hypothetical protein
MGSRGRQSANDLAIIDQANPVERMPPPGALTDRERVEWMRIVNEFPAEYFNAGQRSMLKQYVKHVAHADIISGQIADLAALMDGADDEGGTQWLEAMPMYDKLLKMQERETRAMASLGIRLGFAKSAHREQGAKKGNVNPKPWE